MSYRDDLVDAVPLACAAHKERFLAYARSFRTGEPDHDVHLKLKERHTFGVLQHARRVADQEDCFGTPDMRRALLLAALYHDIGRFPQFSRYKTFSDPRSCNHGHLACQVLKSGIFLTEENRETRQRVLTAALLHNRFSLPSAIPQDMRRITQAVRDADKLDILRVMRGNLGLNASLDPVVVLHLPDSHAYTPAVLDAVAQRRLASFTQLRTTTDLRLLLCGWYYDLNFQASREQAARAGHLASIVDALPNTPEMRRFTQGFRRELLA